MIDIKRNITTIVASSRKYVYSGVHMGEKTVTVTVQSPTPITFLKGDAVVYNNNTFRLRVVPTGHQVYNSELIEYTLEFKHEQYELGLTSFKDVVPEGGASEAYYNNTSNVVTIGTVENLMGRIISNMNRTYAGWSFVIGAEVELVEKDIILNNQKCSDALALVSSLFGLQYWITGKQIRVGGTASVVGGVFEYGKNKGICEITRSGENKEITTRLFAYGSSRNIPSDYNVTEDYKNNPRLMLPNFVSTGVNHIDSPLIDLNNIEEGELSNDSIFPSINDGTGRNQIVLMDNIEEDLQAGFYVHIKDIGFNINDKLTSKPPVLSMISGLTTGLEFEITEVIPYTDAGFPEEDKITGAAYRLLCKRNTTIENRPLPNNVVKMINGDKFVLLDILMDESYVLNAETRLLEWAQKQFSEQNIDKQKTTYSAKFTEEYIDANPAIKDTILEGSLVHIKSTEFDIDDNITIQTLTITHDESPFPKYDLSIANTVIASKFTSVIDSVKNVENELQYKVSTDDIKAQQTSENIRLLEEANKAVVFGESINNFIVDGNVNINNSALTASGGTIVHRGKDVYFGINNTQANKVWLIADQYLATLDVNKTFRLYIKASKTSSSAWWIHSENELIQDTDDFFYFEWGTIFPIDENGKRPISSTKGITAIVGGTIYTEMTRSLNGFSYSDWENNRAIWGDGTNGWDWNVTTPNTMTTRGMQIQSPSGITQPLGVNRGTYSPLVTYYVGDQVYYDQSTYLCITQSLGNDPKTGYWQAVALKGEPFSFDQGLLVDRPDATTEAIGYSYFATDTSLLYMVIAGNPQTWNEGAPFGKGEDGKTYYTWIKYTDVLDRTLGFNGKTLGLTGGQVLDDNRGAVYLGISYNNESPTESLNQADYTWTKIKGDDGATGASGLNGDTYEYRYAKNGSPITPPSLNNTDRTPIGWSIEKPSIGAMEAIWMIRVKISGVTGNLIGNWTSPNLETFNDKVSIGLTYEGIYNSGAVYTGTTSSVQSVLYNGRYYYTRPDIGSFNEQVPTNLNYWCPFGNQVSSMATGLLLAQSTVIENLIAEHIKTSTSGKRVEVNEGDSNAIVTYDSNGNEVVRIDDNMSGGYGSDESGVRVQNGSTKTAMLTPSGVFANHANMNMYPSSTGKEGVASVVGLGFANVNKNFWDDNFICGGYFRSYNDGTAKKYASVHDGDVRIDGICSGRKPYLELVLQAQSTDIGSWFKYYGEDSDWNILISSTVGTGTNTINLPLNTAIGTVYTFSWAGTSLLTAIKENGNTIINKPQGDNTPSILIKTSAGWKKL